MTMRKKDYEAIAQVFNDERTYYDHDSDVRHAQQSIAKLIADYCATQDPTFKRDRFLADCGVQS